MSYVGKPCDPLLPLFCIATTPRKRIRKKPPPRRDLCDFGAKTTRPNTRAPGNQPFDNPPRYPYRVLARKYRPQTFAESIGQDAMVTTLGNAIRRGRLAHAFLLTGVRGVGKTSTARLLAKALNCIGPEGSSHNDFAPGRSVSHRAAGESEAAPRHAGNRGQRAKPVRRSGFARSLLPRYRRSLTIFVHYW